MPGRQLDVQVVIIRDTEVRILSMVHLSCIWWLQSLEMKFLRKKLQINKKGFKSHQRLRCTEWDLREGGYLAYVFTAEKKMPGRTIYKEGEFILPYGFREFSWVIFFNYCDKTPWTRKIIEEGFIWLWFWRDKSEVVWHQAPSMAARTTQSLWLQPPARNRVNWE